MEFPVSGASASYPPNSTFSPTLPPVPLLALPPTFKWRPDFQILAQEFEMFSFEWAPSLPSCHLVGAIGRVSEFGDPGFSLRKMSHAMSENIIK